MMMTMIMMTTYLSKFWSVRAWNSGTGKTFTKLRCRQQQMPMPRYHRIVHKDTQIIASVSSTTPSLRAAE